LTLNLLFFHLALNILILAKCKKSF